METCIYEKKGMRIMVDSSDLPLLEGWKVSPVKWGRGYYGQLYRWCREKKKSINKALHRHLMGDPEGKMICHLDGNGLNCTRKNMEIGNHKNNGSSHRRKNENATSQYRGVHLNRGRGKKWTVMFWDDGKCIYCGRYNDEIEAAKVYDKEATSRFGKFAHLNFQKQPPTGEENE